jgi:cytidylate kinase
MPSRPGAIPETDLPGPPLHGFRGDAPAPRFAGPKGLTVALSREAGARGATIARKVGELLGWQVFDQEVLDYLMVDETGRTQLVAELPAGAKEWADAHLARLQRDGRVNPDPDTTDLARLVLTVAARGDVVIVGRGAGFLLPAESTLHVRIVAPFEARVGYLAQAMRLTREEAAAEVRARDERRARFLAHAVFRDPADPTRYDVVVNSTRLGVESAAQFIGWALRIKQQFAELAAPADEDRES